MNALIDREALLYNALKATNDDTILRNHFTVFERMLINQERAGIFRALAALDDDIEIDRYEVSAKIEEKIQWIINLINNRNNE